MNKKEKYQAHEYFSKQCFNKCWEIMDKSNRSMQDDIEMIATCFASYYHWKQRNDQTDENLSVGYWQLSRVFSLVNDASNAIKYGKLCLEISKKDRVIPFYLGYAYEALARAEMINNNKMSMDKYLDKANNICKELPNNDEKKYLLDDLSTIKL